ncbi:uncharacterized protein MELLADRAFT_69780 [Melampsora larici-populina 98AG31]|uniref:Type 1 phosphatases regulator n=1 Tax=Melampsora larici-populina (strain 98AG31 / pathotype 3-4-7) TaxID=747676 RepID=F4SC53_MELLP|nr:uncharacterized protein MELLADRAFT_69780 [Melampsora larici-populina 98AG31]EGF97777.1 hypothetical protein MELLADRAFT_69780 [Melampsora larici-populina 98AG31]
MNTSTITITSSDDPSTTHSNHQSQPQSSVLILRAHPLINNPSQVRQTRVQWSENVIDNEGLGRKKSKVCCIYKKPRAFDESSDESDNSSDSDCCQHSSNSQPHPSNKSIPNNPSHSHSAEHRSSVRSSPPTAVNAYEAEPINSKGIFTFTFIIDS